jgi:TP901 family phage tail tape measure protein
MAAFGGNRAIQIALLLSANTTAASRAIDNFVSRTGPKMERLSKIADNMMQKGAGNIASGLAIGAPIALAVKTASEFQDKMIDIRKQMQTDTPKSVAVMTQAVMASAKKIPLAMGEIQDLFSSGLRMGIAEKDIQGFTQQAAKMSVAFDISAGQISEDMAGIAKAFKVPISNIGSLGDAINYLDDNTLAKGADIIDVMKRTAGTAKYLSSEQNAAISSTLLTLQEVPDRAGTAINSIVNTLAAAGAQSKRSRMMMMALGFNPDQLQKDMVTNAQGTIMKVMDRISTLQPDKQQSAIFQIFGKEFTPTINKLVNNMGEYRSELSMLNGAQKGSMDREYQKRLASASSQYQLLKNRATAFGVSIGNALLPQLTKLMTQLQPLIDRLMNWVNANPKLVNGLLKAAIAFAGFKLGLGAIQVGIGGTIKQVTQFWGLFYNSPEKKLTMLGTAFKGIGSAVFSVGKALLTNPIGLTITAIGIAAFLLIKYWKPISTFFINLWNKVKSVFSTVLKLIVALLVRFTPVGLIYKNWSRISGWFSGLWSGVKNVFGATIGFLGTLLLNFTPVGLIFKHWGTISSWFGGIWDGVKNIFNGFIDWVSNTWVGKVLNFIKSIPSKIKNAFSFASSHSLSDVVDKVGGVTPQPKINPSNRSSINTYSPVINIHGNATASDARKINANVIKSLKDYQEQQKRVGFAY